MTPQQTPAPKISEGTVELKVEDGSSMRAFWARSSQLSEVSPGLLLFQEAFGVDAHIKDVARRFAAQGFSVLAPQLFHRTAVDFVGSHDDFPSIRPHIKALTNPGLEADIRASYDWLGGKAAAAKIAAIGYCMGGRTAFLAAATVPLCAAVSYYGGGIAPMEALGNPGLLDKVGELKAPVLFYWGGADQNIPPADRRKIADALTTAGKVFAWVEFSDAGHGFFNDTRQSYNSRAAAQSWALTLDFLKGR